MNVERQLRSILDRWKKGAGPIGPDTRLDDLGLDSLNLVEVMFEVEEAFEIKLTQDNDEARAASFRVMCEWIEQQQAVKAELAGGPAGEHGTAGAALDLEP